LKNEKRICVALIRDENILKVNKDISRRHYQRVIHMKHCRMESCWGFKKNEKAKMEAKCRTQEK